MDGLGMHLPPVLSDPFFDISGHNPVYHPYQPQTNPPWISPGGREDGRTYQNQGQAEFDTHIRYPGPAGRRGCPLETNTETNDGDSTQQNDWNADSGAKETKKSDSASPRQSQVALTLSWLSDNYERAEGVCLPRCVLYQHYLDFCKKMKFTPAGAATFGKIIRQRFPKLTTRRLGTRGQSKYHYYGIGIKESSVYYHSVYSGKGLTRFSGIKLKTEGSSRKYSLSSKTGTLLPEFPSADNLILPEGTDLDKMRTFIMMYRTHCQRILDTIISANFEEVQNFLVHFWQGMPEHLIDLLQCPILTDVLALCDSILYKVLIDVLIPSTIQELPQSLFGDMRMFAKQLPYWLETSMETVPDHIQSRKMEVAKSFLQSFKRQSSFIHLAQTARTVLTNQDTLTQMVKDISNADFVDICSQAGFMEPSANPKLCLKLQDFYLEFKNLLKKQAAIEGYTEWIDDIVDSCVIQPSEEDRELFKDKAAEFLLQWGAFGALLMRELTLKNASSFASIHLVHLMLDEYAFLVIETQQEQEVEKRLQTDLQKHMKNAEEIQTKAVVRNSSNKALNSPKSKKRKHSDELDNDMTNGSEDAGNTTSELSAASELNMANGTAFSRPIPSNKDTHVQQSQNLSHDTTRQQQGAISIPSLKPYQPYNNSYDRPTYLPQIGIGSYPDYVGHNASFPNGRIPTYSDSYPQTFPSNPFTSNISPVSGSYWTEARSHHTFTDPYQSYNYNKLSATYDNLNKNTFLRGNTYQDSFNRPAFDTSRSFYRSTHDNMQVGTPLPVGTYSSNFMDIAPPAGQYCYQDDIFPGAMATTFGKPYLSGPFR